VDPTSGADKAKAWAYMNPSSGGSSNNGGGGRPPSPQSNLNGCLSVLAIIGVIVWLVYQFVKK
jgi:hypothetical protein